MAFIFIKLPSTYVLCIRIAYLVLFSNLWDIFFNLNIKIYRYV